MSEFSFPFTGGGSGDDGPYSASFFASILEGLFRQDPTARANASVLVGSGNGTDDALEVLETSPASTSVEVKSGKALVQGYYYHNDSDLTLTISANNDGSGYDRIDTIALEINFVAQTVRGIVVEGTPSGSPVAPTLTKNVSVYQVPIANVTAQNLFTTIVDADIDNTVREQAILWDAKQGGTGIEGGFVDRDMLYANGVDQFTTVNLPEGHIPVGGSSSIDSIDHRIIEVYGTAYTANNVFVWTKSSFTTLNDPTGYASLSSGSLLLEAGTYLFIGAMQSGIRTAVIGHGIRLNNSTAGVIIDEVEIRGVTSPSQSGTFIIKLGGQEFDSNGTDSFDAEVSGCGS